MIFIVKFEGDFFECVVIMFDGLDVVYCSDEIFYNEELVINFDNVGIVNVVVWFMVG